MNFLSMHIGEKKLLMTLSSLYVELTQLRPTHAGAGAPAGSKESTDLEEGDAHLGHSLQNHAHSMW